MFSWNFWPGWIYRACLAEAKAIVQQLYKKKYEWDDKVPSETTDEWNKWYQDEAGNINEVRIRWCVNVSAGASNVRYELVLFTDASKNA